jgi:hypothetical protein
MPRLKQSVPRYRKHKQSGQAIVILSGRDHLLGPHVTKASSKLLYDRLITEWLTRGHQPAAAVDDGTTVVEAIARYWRHAQVHCAKNCQPTGEQAGIRCALRFVRRMYGAKPAEEFSPLALKAVGASGKACSIIQTMPSTARAAAAELHIDPQLIINGVPHDAKDDIERIGHA